DTHRDTRRVERRHAVPMPGDGLDRDDALLRGRVRQEEWPDEVADGGQRLRTRPHRAVDGDETTVRSHAERIQLETFRQRCAPDGCEYAVRVKRPRTGSTGDGHACPVALELQVLEAMAEEHLDALPAERPLELAPQVSVHARQQRVGHLHDGDSAAAAGVGVRELDTHPAAAPTAHADRGVRERGSRARLPSRRHNMLVDPRPGGGPLAASSGEEHVAPGETLRLRAVALPLHAARDGRAPPLHELYVVLAEEGL